MRISRETWRQSADRRRSRAAERWKRFPRHRRLDASAKSAGGDRKWMNLTATSRQSPAAHCRRSNGRNQTRLARGCARGGISRPSILADGDAQTKEGISVATLSQG